MTFCKVIFSILYATSPLLAQEASAPKTENQVLSQWESGTAAIARLRTAYEKGEFDSFLKEMDESYTQAKKENRLDALAEMRTMNLPPLSHQDKWEDRAFQLQKEKNQELIDALGDDSSPFAEKIKNMTQPLTPEEETALRQLAFYRNMTPGTGKNNDEEQLIELDLEYEYKSLHLDMPSQEVSLADRQEKQYILRMEKMDRMEKMSQAFTETPLQQIVQAAQKSTDLRLSRTWDAIDLNALVKGKRKPANLLEGKIASVLSLYQSKYNELSKEFIESETVQNEVQE